MKAKEVHKLNEEEIALEVTRLRRRLFELGGQAVTEKIEDVSQFGAIRKDIARLLTEKNARRTVRCKTSACPHEGGTSRSGTCECSCGEGFVTQS